MTPPNSSGPYLLRLVGTYGFGKRSVIEIEDVEVMDLSSPPETDPESVQPASERQRASLSFLSEDASPEAGIGFDFNNQHFTCTAAGEWIEE